MGRGQDVVCRKHESLGFDLGLDRKRDMNGHLVTVEIRVKGRADKRMDLDGLALDKEWARTPVCPAGGEWGRG